MKTILALALILSTAVPALAQTAIKGIDLSAADAGRVDRQCDALRVRESGSLASNPPEEPTAGVIVSDPASYWAEHANGVDAALARINLDTLTVRDCREAGFYK